jgi:phosphate transport system substrate-binding protein
MSTAISVSRGGRLSRHRALAVVVTLLVAVATLASGQSAAWASSPTMQSTGSSFAAVAIQEWVAQTATLFGLNINWQVQSSVVGLNDFATDAVDFGASDIPYSSQQAQSTPTFPYQYMPDVAGGLSFMYNLDGNDGQRINSLILNAQTIDQIFLGEITTWNSPSIAQLNPQLAGDLPSTKIIPVYRTDASGENYLLSDYLLSQDGANFTGAQKAFQAGGSLGYGQPSAVWPTPTPGVSYNQSAYPGWAAANPVGQNGSDNAANYVSSLSSQGSITYVETAYAKEHDFPVASLMNESGNAVQPTSLNVATALEAAILYPDLTQNLSNVYINRLANAYPLSAYSYLVTPCTPSLAIAQHGACAANMGAASTFPSQKGYALGQFVSFMACLGQSSMATLGYSPLPPNLVQDDLNAVARMTGGVPDPVVANASNCKNPYVDGQIPLPGEPAVQGQAGGGISATQTAAAGGGIAAVAATGQGVSGSSSAATGAGTLHGSTKGLTAAQVAAGERIVDGHLVKPVAAGPNKFLRAAALVSASKDVEGLPLSQLLGWTLAAAVGFVGIPLLIGYRRRRRGGKSTAGPSTGGPGLDPESTP